MNWPSTRVVVTGGAGFLGSYVVKALEAKGCKVFVPRSHYYDLSRRDSVCRLLIDSYPDIIIHLAANVGGIHANLQNPAKFLYSNLMMGMHLFEEGRLFRDINSEDELGADIKKLVIAGTICAYPKHTPVPFKEEDLWNGYPEETNAPYGLAKKMLLVASQAYRQQYNFNSVVLFPVNLYGPGDNFDFSTSHVIPAMIRKIDAAIEMGDNEVWLWGDGTPTREFLYVEDCAEAFVKACEQYDSSEPVNLGSGREISIADLAKLIGELMGYKGAFYWNTEKPNGQPRRCLDTQRAKKFLDWQATTSLEDGLKKTIEWWQKHKKENENGKSEDD